MKTTINLTIHAPSRKAAKACFDHLLSAWNSLHKSGEAPVDTFLEYGTPRTVRPLQEMTETEMDDKRRRREAGKE